MQQYLSPALTLCFQRLQAASTPKFSSHFVRALAALVHARGAALVLGAMDAVQPGIFLMVLNSLWLNGAAARLSDADERKVCAVGTIDLLCRAPEAMLNGPYAAAWPRLLACALDLTTGDGGDEASGGDDDDEAAGVAQLAEMAGYTSAFCRLAFAGGVERDAAARVQSAPQYLAQSLGALSTSMPQKVCII